MTSDIDNYLDDGGTSIHNDGNNVDDVGIEIDNIRNTYTHQPAHNEQGVHVSVKLITKAKTSDDVCTK